MSRHARLILMLWMLAALLIPAAATAGPAQPTAPARFADFQPGGVGRVAPPSDSVETAPVAVAGADEMNPPDTWHRIAFQSHRSDNWDIFSMRPGGSELRQLTADPAQDGRPHQSAADGRIAFVSDRTGNFDVFTVAADGSGLRQLTSHPAEDNYPAWSPDGKRIAFASNRGNSWDIFVMNADGSGVVPVTSGPETDYSPTWSPDGTRVAWVRIADKTSRIFIANADGSNAHPATSNLYFAENLSWGYDAGEKIVFDCDCAPNGFTELAVVHFFSDGSTGEEIIFYPGGPLTDALMGGITSYGRILMSIVKYKEIDQELYIESSRLARTTFSYALEYLPGSGMDMDGDWQRTDFIAPTSQLNRPPAFSQQGVNVSWRGWDAGGSGLSQYEMQYKVDNGAWQQGSYSGNESTFISGYMGSTLYFRVRAIDAAGNVEPWPSAANGEGQTIIYNVGYTGLVLDNRHTPIPGARIEGADNPNIPFFSGPDGQYAAYSFTNFERIVASDEAYGHLPNILTYSQAAERIDIVLPPKIDAVTNGGFEQELSGWQFLTGEGVIYNDGMGHSGRGAVRVGKWRPTGPGVYGISQQITVPVAAERPTLAFFAKRDSDEMSLDMIGAAVKPGSGPAASLKLHWLETRGWSHAWADLTEWAGQTVTMTFSVTQKGGEPEGGTVFFDEISVGGWHTPRIAFTEGPELLPGMVTIHGDNFEPGAVAQVGGASLITTYVDSATLTAALPQGVGIGYRDLWVTNPGGEQAQARILVGKPVYLPVIGLAE